MSSLRQKCAYRSWSPPSVSTREVSSVGVSTGATTGVIVGVVATEALSAQRERSSNKSLFIRSLLTDSFLVKSLLIHPRSLSRQAQKTRLAASIFQLAIIIRTIATIATVIEPAIAPIDRARLETIAGQETGTTSGRLICTRIGTNSGRGASGGRRCPRSRSSGRAFGPLPAPRCTPRLRRLE